MLSFQGINLRSPADFVRRIDRQEDAERDVKEKAELTAESVERIDNFKPPPHAFFDKSGSGWFSIVNLCDDSSENEDSDPGKATLEVFARLEGQVVKYEQCNFKMYSLSCMHSFPSSLSFARFIQMHRLRLA